MMELIALAFQIVTFAVLVAVYPRLSESLSGQALGKIETRQEGTATRERVLAPDKIVPATLPEWRSNAVR